MRISLRASLTVLAALVCCSGAASGAQGTFHDQSGPGGGHVVTALLGRDTSLNAALAATLRHIHEDFGSRPVLTRLTENSRTHSLAAAFTETRNGRPYVGITVIEAIPGTETNGAVLYDTQQRFASTIKSMLGRLATMTSPQTRAARPSHLAPAEPLERHTFSDGTGSIDLPADWKLLSGGGGTTSASGPTGELVSYDLVLTAIDPSNPTAQNYVRGLPAQYRQTYLRRTAILGYTSDPLQAWKTGFGQLARQNGRPEPAFSVSKVVPIGADRGLHLDEITGQGTIPGIAGKADDAPGSYVAFVQVTPPDPMGQWSMYSTFAFVPNAELGRMGKTAIAVFDSIRINFQAVNAQSDAIRQSFQKSFEAMLARSQANVAAMQDRTQAFLANQSAAQEGMHKWVVSEQNFALDRETIANVTTGEHHTVSDEAAAALVQPGSDYRTVPPSELLKGVDY